MQKLSILLFILFISISTYKIERINSPQYTSLRVVPWPFTICGQGDWKMQRLTLQGQPQRSANSSFTMIGVATADTAFTYVDYVVKINGAFLHQDTQAFKRNYEESDTIQYFFEIFIPNFAPPGTYTVTSTFKNGNNDNGCFSLSFKL